MQAHREDAMPIYEFMVVVEGIDIDDPDHDARLTAAGAPDAMLSQSDGVTRATFHREAPNPAAAAEGAVASLRHAYPQASVVRLDPDLVATSEIADRVNMSREAVRKYVTGALGNGTFPAPVGVVGKGQRVWEWTDVDRWFRQHTTSLQNEALPIPRRVVVDVDHDLIREASRPGAQPATSKQAAVN